MKNLFSKYLNDQCSPQEVKALLNYFNMQENELLLKSLIRERLEQEVEIGTEWEEVNRRSFSVISRHIEKNTATVTPFYKHWWVRLAAAAVLILGLLGVYQVVKKEVPVEARVTAPGQVPKDVTPGGSRAMLTLANGTQIILDSTANGQLVQQGNSSVTKNGAQLSYIASGKAVEMVYNTITVPRGGEYELVLADGSKVWLNSSSTLRFPTSFEGGERKVELTGEGYFEVTKNARQPFKVGLSNGMLVEVPGTHFNIMGYDDEAAIKTTLLEGKVKVLAAAAAVMLSPGQQASLFKTSLALTVDKSTDVNKAIAWKNGVFDFSDDDITDIMRQLSRWYDVDIRYQGKITAQIYTGSIRRQVNISRVLYMLEQAGGVSFNIDGKTIEVITK